MSQEYIQQSRPNGPCVQDKASHPNMITVLRKLCVYPAQPSDQKYCDLITFDLPYVNLQYNQKILLYPSPNQGFVSVVESLEKSLSEALVHFYPLAGRLCLDEDGILKVDCNDAGVDFIEASSHDGLSDLTDCDSSSHVTKLIDGVAIGIAINHLIADGYSTWHFISSWAELCRGSSAIFLPPLHDRTVARNIKVKLNLNPSTRDSYVKGTKTEKLPLRGKIFHFSKKMMDEIKAAANKNREGKPFSFFQALGAHLWQGITRARKLAPEDITVFTLFIDCRTRVDPPLPKSYFGNAIQGIYRVTAVGLLQSNGLSFAANMLQQVIDSHGAKPIKKKNDEWEQNPKLYGFSDAGMNCVTVGSSPRFEVYENDFGWGSPVRVRSGCNNTFDGMVYLYPGQEGGGSVDVEIALMPQTMDILDSDPEFLLTN